MCKQFNLRIANGRIPGDRLGSFTCYTNKGASVVDYFISDQNFSKKLKRMRVLDPDFSSIHAPLSFQKNVPQKKAPLPPQPKFIWDPSKQEHFKLLLAQKVDVFNSINEGLSSPDCSIENTDLLIKLLTDTIYNCAS